MREGKRDVGRKIKRIERRETHTRTPTHTMLEVRQCLWKGIKSRCFGPKLFIGSEKSLGYQR